MSDNTDPGSKNLPGFIEWSVSILGSLGVAEIAPPNDQPFLSRLVHIVVIAGMLLPAFLLTRDLDESKRKRIVWIGLTAFLVGLTLLTTYLFLRSEWTVLYEDGRRIVGSVLTEAGRIYFDESPNAAPEKAVFDNGGNAAGIWTLDSIGARRNWLWPIHLLGFSTALFLILLCWRTLGGNSARSGLAD
jgi:hypothetical protein